MEELLQGLPMEEILQGLPMFEPSQGIQFCSFYVFPMEEFLRCLSMEELFERLTMEEHLQGLSMEELLQGLPMEEPLQGFPMEELLRASTETCNGGTSANVSVLVFSRDFQWENLYSRQATRCRLIRG